MKMPKRLITIIAIIVGTMLIIPLITVHTVKAEAGMLVTIILFFIVNPIVSVVIGMLAGREIKLFWFSPILVAGLFWLFSSFTYETAFPIIYSAAYFVLCTIVMLITHFIAKRNKA